MSIRYETDTVMVITGQRGSGKTTLAKYIIKNLDSFVLFDVNIEYHDFGTVAKKISDIWRLWQRGIRKIRYVGRCEDQDFRQFIQLIWGKLYNTVIVVEEAEGYFMNKPFPLRGIKNLIIHRGRHKALGLIVITRRIAALHKDVLSQARTIISFFQFIGNDIDYLRKFM